MLKKFVGGVRSQESGDRRQETAFFSPLPHTPHPTPHTLHPTPYTLHPTPYTPHPSARDS
ncbi:hypothetical protein [Microcystis aeruginosa]|uniref:hypothetical protein n=1 Tax=Microcystis aeruginosa TaxID=1126 RepID=UPI000930A7D5|nr:hypothetical protein [Microcystis aeruginosa]